MERTDFKKLLIYFFAIEHVLVIAAIVFLAFSFSKIYAAGTFGKLQEKAQSFTPTDEELIYEDIKNQMIRQIFPNVILGRNEYSFTLDVSEEYVNSLFGEIATGNDFIDQVYFSFDNGDTILLYLKIKDLKDPLMIEAVYDLDLEEFTFNIDTTKLRVGQLPLPIYWADFVENILKDTINEYLVLLGDVNDFKINQIATHSGGVSISFTVNIDTGMSSEGISYLKDLLGVDPNSFLDNIEDSTESGSLLEE